MSFLKKVENIWYYYKWPIIIISVIIIALYMLISTFSQGSEPSDVEIVSVYSAYVSEKEIDFQKKFEKSISDADKNGGVVIDLVTSYITADGKSDDDAIEIAKFEGTMSTARSDLILMDEYNFRRFETKDYYEDLRKFLDISKFNDEDVLYRNDIPVAVRLRESKILKEAEYETDNIYAGIMFVPDDADETLLARRQNAVEILKKLAEK